MQIIFKLNSSSMKTQNSSHAFLVSLFSTYITIATINLLFKTTFLNMIPLFAPLNMSIVHPPDSGRFT